MTDTVSVTLEIPGDMHLALTRRCEQLSEGHEWDLSPEELLFSLARDDVNLAVQTGQLSTTGQITGVESTATLIPHR